MSAFQSLLISKHGFLKITNKEATFLAVGSVMCADRGCGAGEQQNWQRVKNTSMHFVGVAKYSTNHWFNTVTRELFWLVDVCSIFLNTLLRSMNEYRLLPCSEHPFS